MDYKQHSLSKLFDKQDTVSLDDLNDDDEEESLASGSKASIAGHFRSMLTRSTSRMSISKDAGTDNDDMSITSSSEGSVMSARSVLSRAASGISSTLRRGSNLLKSSSLRSISSFRQNKEETGRSTLYGSHDDSSNSSLESLGTSGDLSRQENDMPSKPNFDLTVMTMLDTYGKEMTVNEDDRSTVWVQSGEESVQHLQLDIQNNHHSSTRSLALDQLGSSHRTISTSKGSIESFVSSDLDESHHSQHPTRTRRRRRPRRYSIDRVTSGTFTSTESELTNQSSMYESGKCGDTGLLATFNQVNSGMTAGSIRNPRRRRTQRPKGFSNMKLHSSSGSINQVDQFHEMGESDIVGTKNQIWADASPLKPSLSQNALVDNLSRKTAFNRTESKIRHRNRENSEEKRCRRVYCSASECLCTKARNATLSQDMLDRLGETMGVKSRMTNHKPSKSQKSVLRTLSADAKFSSVTQPHPASHRSVSLVDMRGRQESDTLEVQNEAWGFDLGDGKKANKEKAALRQRERGPKKNSFSRFIASVQLDQRCEIVASKG